jgi:L-ascorbate metabolism protein UlaG (beta-lactamase superfamily)
MYFIIIVAVVFSITLLIYNYPSFGKLPQSKRLSLIKQLQNYKHHQIENLIPTPAKDANTSYWQIMARMIAGNKRSRPSKPFPFVKSDFKNSEELKITWFGHSSYLLQFDGLNILVDPVFSNRPSPFQFIGTKNFDGTEFSDFSALPTLDAILITHDHYDHLDYGTIKQLKAKTKLFITSLGVGEHLVKWGVNDNTIFELKWGETFFVNDYISLTATPARHFSGRGLKRNQTLWSSFVLQTKNNKIFIGGDSGFDGSFEAIGNEHGPFDLAILECGQYDKMWPYIHMFPAEVIKASLQLKTKHLLPVHWGKFSLALHNWDEPINTLIDEAKHTQLFVLTPKIGQTFNLQSPLPTEKWWQNL